MLSINDYKVVKKLGAGAFGTTYLVTRNKRNYAIKVIRENLIDQDAIKDRRIEREIRVLKGIESKSTVKYIDDGILNDGLQNYRYIVMEYLEGETLENFIKNNKLTLQQSCLIMKNIFEALYSIHQSNIIHRDLKPANIMVLNENLDIKVLDFGISKLIDASTLTTTGEGMGTFAYMAPEQLRSAKDIDFRSDYYSAGVIFYELLTDEKPLKMSNQLEAIRKILEEIPEPVLSKVPTIPLDIAEIIDVLLKKEPFERYLTYEEITSTLVNWTNKIRKKVNTRYFSTELAYVPITIHNDSLLIIELAKSHKLNGAYFTGPQLMQSDKNYKLLKENHNNIRLFLDPFTQSLAYSAFTSKSTYKSLPYVISKIKKETPKDFKMVSAIQERAKKSIDFQRNYSPSIYISPYHFLSSETDPWINVDYNVYKESKKYLQSLGVTNHLYYGISFNIEQFEDTDTLRDLINFITSASPDGFILQISGAFDSLNSNHYYAYAYLVSILSKHNKEIILTKINDFSLGLLGIGATTISTGLGQSDNFKEDFLKREDQGGPLRRYYIKELLGLYNKNILQDILSTNVGKSLICNCQYCNSSVNIDKLCQFHNAIKHNYLTKHNQIKTYSALNTNDRLNYFYDSIDEAINLIKNINKEKKIKNLNYKHFQVWKEVLVEFNSIHSSKISIV